MQTRLAILYFVVVFLSYSFNSVAKDNPYEDFFSFKHKTCNVKIIPLQRDYEYLESTLRKSLKSRHFNPTFITSAKDLRQNDLYITITSSKDSTKPYKKCIVETKLLRASANYRISSSDNVLNERKSKRAFPRITFSGKERCTRALRDTFLHIPYCKVIKR